MVLKMTTEKLAILCKLLRMGESTFTGAHLVYFGGLSQRQAALRVHMAPCNLNRALRKIRALDQDIRGAYASQE